MRKVKFILILFLMLSCDDIIEVEDISDGTVLILAPTNNATLTTTEVNFSWDMLDDAEKYKLQIATPTFEEATQILLDTIITITNFNKTLDVGNYEWRIRAENSVYQTSYTTQSFTIE